MKPSADDTWAIAVRTEEREANGRWFFTALFAAAVAARELPA